jgi:hypothetical protein
MEPTVAIRQLLDVENKLGLYDEKCCGFPIWRLYRFRDRARYLKIVNEEFAFQSRKRNYSGWFKVMIKNTWKSLSGIFSLLVCGNKYDNFVFAFPRLQNVNNKLIDKFTDPVIDNSDLRNSTRIFQMTNRDAYIGDRWHSDKIVQSEFLLFLSRMGAIFYLPFHAFTQNYRSIRRLFSKAKSDFRLTTKDLIKWQYLFCSFFLLVKMYVILYKRVCVKRIFVVSRPVYLAQIVAAHRCNMPVYELQHGVTCGETQLYSGPYCPIADPDYFLTFGSIWIGTQFAIPVEKIMNIGWAYKDFISTIPSLISHDDNAILVISSPEISRIIVETVISLAQKYKNFKFHIRCHPQEELSSQLLQMIGKQDNIDIADNTIDSFIALRSYKHIIGENSSVLYEGLSMGKNVGKLCYNGLNEHLSEEVKNDGFFYIDNEISFTNFMRHQPVKEENNELYSDFKPEIVNNLK